jgi:hypothetical protein
MQLRERYYSFHMDYEAKYLNKEYITNIINKYLNL